MKYVRFRAACFESTGTCGKVYYRIMISVSPEAAEIIRKQGNTVFLDLPKAIATCCFDFQESPTVRIGAPHDKDAYIFADIEGITVYLPRVIAGIELSIEVASFLGFKRLIVEGWRYC